MDIRSFTYEEMEDYVKELGLPRYRAGQIYQWIHQKLAQTPAEMTNLPKSLREELGRCWTGVEEEARLQSQDTETCKFLFRLWDDNLIESVWMGYKHGNSVCISSQAGCRMGCRFCASTVDGLVRNLTASEMSGQIYAMQRQMNAPVSNIVVMGTGEPLDNYENLLRFLHTVTDERGLHISQRNITISTCGLAPEIRRLAEEGLQVTLALSLHATTDKERQALMPIARQYPLGEVMEACRYYFQRTGRRVTYEYSLIRDVNDTPEHARRLSELLKSYRPCHVNLIPINPVRERDFRRSTGKSIQKFKYILENNQINVTIRRGMGSDIDAACGQLRRNYIEKHR